MTIISSRSTKAFLAGCISLLAFQVQAQSFLGISPTSRFGLGDMVPEYATRNWGMAGAGMANPDPDFVNFQNPALLSYQKLSNLEVGLGYNANSWRDTANTFNSRGGGLSYLSFTFPLTPKLTSNVSFLPVNSIDYVFRSTSRFSDSSVFQRRASGSGGLNRVNFGFGYQLTPRLSAGIMPSFIFGQLNNSVEYGVVVRNELGHNTTYSNTLGVADFTMRGGLNYRMPLDTNNRSFLSIGVMAELGRSLGGSRLADILYNPAVNSTVYRSGDTLSSITDKVTYPGTYAFALSYTKPLKWGVSADFTYRTFEGSVAGNTSLPYKNTFKAALGGEWTPNAYSQNYLGICTYRAGVSYGQLPLVLSGNQMTDMNVAVGMTAPITRKEAKFTRPYLNVALIWGAYGGLSTNGLQNNYFRLSFSATLNDATWFKRYKHD